MQKLKNDRAHREHGQNDHLLAERFMELFRFMKRYVRKEVAPTSEMKMSEERIRCLSALRHLGKSRLKSLAAYDGLSTPVQCLMLNQLVQEGLAARSDDVVDRRNVFYELIDAGRALLDSELARRADFFRERLNRLGGAEKASLAEAIEKVLAGVQKLANS